MLPFFPLGGWRGDFSFFPFLSSPSRASSRAAALTASVLRSIAATSSSIASSVISRRSWGCYPSTARDIVEILFCPFMYKKWTKENSNLKPVDLVDETALFRKCARLLEKSFRNCAGMQPKSLPKHADMRQSCNPSCAADVNYDIMLPSLQVGTIKKRPSLVCPSAIVKVQNARPSFL